jgi:hypothetical protein
VKKVLLLMSVVVFFGGQLYAQDYQQAQNKLKSIFIYNFLKYVEWPNYKHGDHIEICLYGQEAIYTELSNLASSKTVQNRKLSIVKMENMAECKSCDLIFVHTSSGIKINDDSRNGGCDAFVVTDNDYHPTVSNINLKYKDNRLGFEINPALCEDFGFKIASELKSLAF